jgi:hypothetical protein
MFDFANRETLILIAVLVSLAATYYLYTEMKRQKEDIHSVKAYVSHKLARTPAHEAKKQPKSKPVDEEVEELEEEEED